MPFRAAAIWTALSLTIIAPIVLAANSPLLQWREPIYIAAGFFGIIGLALLLVQPLFIMGRLPGVPARPAHRWVGIALVLAIVLHVAGLWVTSPADVVDVLLFRSPTPFSLWGALAMWAAFATAFLVVLRKKIGLRVWRIAHALTAIILVVGTVVHAWLIEGTMESFTKTVLCIFVLIAGTAALFKRRKWRNLHI